MTEPASGHRLERVDGWLPGPNPTGSRPTVAPATASGHWRRFVRCRDGGADRERG